MGERGDEAEHEPSRRPGSDRRDHGRRALGRSQRPPCLGQERAARGCQLDVTAVAPEQLDPELALEPAHLLGERRLRHLQPHGGTAEVQLLGHRHERAQMSQLYETLTVLQTAYIGIGRYHRAAIPCGHARALRARRPRRIPARSVGHVRDDVLDAGDPSRARTQLRRRPCPRGADGLGADLLDRARRLAVGPDLRPHRPAAHADHRERPAGRARGARAPRPHLRHPARLPHRTGAVHAGTA